MILKIESFKKFRLIAYGLRMFDYTDDLVNTLTFDNLMSPKMYNVNTLHTLPFAYFYKNIITNELVT